MADGEVPNTASSPVVADPAESWSGSPFRCCICLDLLYKPVVLACGHTSCFWCVNKSMHGCGASRCPICRLPYYHFPNICPLLHYLLLKLEPEAYKRREMEVFEEEKGADIYSPQLVRQLYEKKLNSGRAGSSENLNDSRHTELLKFSPEKSMKRSISVDDVLCSTCKEMIYKPIVLNCGHVYCEACLYGLRGDPLRCQICESLHPSESPNVFLDLDHFLEEAFPTEYEVRREQVHLKKTQSLAVIPSPNAAQTQDLKAKIPSEIMDWWLNQHMHDIHVGIGCDSCGGHPVAMNMFRRGGHRRSSDGRSQSSSASALAHSDALAGNVPSTSFPVAGSSDSQYIPANVSSPVQQSLVEREDTGEFISPRGDSFTNSVRVIHEVNKIVNNHWVGASMTYTSTLEEIKVLWWNEFKLYPIEGKRYRCKDCKEIIGFDLCERCYNTTSKLPGRFNQQHTLEHKFELDQSRTLRNIFSQRTQANNTLEIPPEGFVADDTPVADAEDDYQNHDDPGREDCI